MKKANALVSILVVLIIGAVGFGGLYILLSPKDTNVVPEPTPTPTPEVEVTASVKPTTSEEDTVEPTDIATTPIVDVTPPADWEMISNLTFLPYEVYRPRGWYYKYFSPTTLGMDPAKLPDASEYAGLLSISQLQSSTAWNDDYKSELMAGYTQSTQMIDGNEWTILEGKTKANELFDSQFVKYGYVKVGGKEYVVKMVSSAADFGGHESKFDILISTLRFK